MYEKSLGSVYQYQFFVLVIGWFRYQVSERYLRNILLFERITLEDIDNICHACCHYDLRKLIDEEQKKLHLDFGEKDFDWKYSKKAVPVYMPNAELVIRPGYQHCGYMAAEPKAYVEQIEAFMSIIKT